MSITITHTQQDGTLVDGTARGDGSAEILKPWRFRWSRNLGQWYIPRSRDRIADRYRIDGAAAALREAGFEVEVSIDNTAEDPAEREQRRDERSEDRADALDAKADRKAGESSQAYERGRQIADMIPMGQPILVGHHSEGRHRRDLARIDSAMHKSVEAQREGEDAARRAAAAVREQQHRMTPDYIANRISERERDERKLDRTLAGKDREVAWLESGERPIPYGHEKAEWIERIRNYYADCEARLEQVRADLVYFRGKLAELEASGVKVYTRADLRPGDRVKVGFGWMTVQRANPKTVSCVSEHNSWPIKYRYTEVKDRHRPGEDSAVA